METTHISAAARARARLTDNVQLGQRLLSRARGGTVRGAFVIELPTPRTVTALALAGFEFVMLDLEHSACSFETLGGLIAAAHQVGIPALVRPWSPDPGIIGKILDSGANGVMVPRVPDASVAAAVVEAARYGPRGARGVCPTLPYSALRDPKAALDAGTFVAVQIEGREGIANASAIAGVPGLDAVVLGPYDLSQSIGVAVDAPEVEVAAERIRRVIPSTTILGIYVDAPASSLHWASRGFTFQIVSFDGRMLLEAARQTLAAASTEPAQQRHPGRRHPTGEAVPA